MILQILRFFNHPILRDIAQAEQDKALLQDRLERESQEKARLWEQNQSLIEKLDLYYRMDKNLEWQSFGRPCPFPDAPHLPPNQVHEPDNSPQPVRLSQGSQFVAAAFRDFKERTAKRFGIEIPEVNASRS